MKSWSKQRILIPGAGGYIGQALSQELESLGATVIPMHIKDVLQARRREWREWLTNIDSVIFLAAQTDAVYSNEIPVMDLVYNVHPFLEMISLIKDENIDVEVVFAGAVTQVGYTNSTTPSKIRFYDRPITVYDIHKLTCEHYIRALEIKGATLRLANVYGPSPGESKGPRGFLNRMIKSAIVGQGIEVYIGLTRDYVYIDDVVEAFLACLEHPEIMAGQSYEIGSGTGYAIDSVADVIAELTGAEVEKVPVPVGIRPIDARSYVCNIEPFIKVTDWRPQVSIKEGIERTIKWLKS